MADFVGTNDDDLIQGTDEDDFTDLSTLQLESVQIIVGTWYIAGPGQDQFVQWSFFADGTYALVESGKPDPSGTAGRNDAVERVRATHRVYRNRLPAWLDPRLVYSNRTTGCVNIGANACNNGL